MYNKYSLLRQMVAQNDYQVCLQALKEGKYLAQQHKTDREIEQGISQYLKSINPDDEFFGEEDHQQIMIDKSSGRYWVCDPIDDSTSYNIFAPFYAIQLTLVKDGQQLVSGVEIPGLNWRFMTYKTKHTEFTNYAHKNIFGIPISKPCQVKPAVNLSEAIISLGGLYDGDQVAFQLARQQIGKARVAYNNWIGFAGLVLGWVDVMMETRIRIWDWLPWMHLIKNAGGMMTNYSGGPPQDGDSIIASTNIQLHQQALNHVRI